MTVAERTADIAHTHTDKQSSKYGEDGREEERERGAERERERERERDPTAGRGIEKFAAASEPGCG